MVAQKYRDKTIGWWIVFQDMLKGNLKSEAPTAGTVRASVVSKSVGKTNMNSAYKFLEAVNTSYVPFNGQQIITAMAAAVAYVAMKTTVENLE